MRAHLFCVLRDTREYIYFADFHPCSRSSLPFFASTKAYTAGGNDVVNPVRTVVPVSTAGGFLGCMPALCPYAGSGVCREHALHWATEVKLTAQVSYILCRGSRCEACVVLSAQQAACPHAQCHYPAIRPAHWPAVVNHGRHSYNRTEVCGWSLVGSATYGK